MGQAGKYFSEDYFAARARFQQATEKAGGRLYAIPLDAIGPGNENLSIDIAWFGSPQPRTVLLHSSGVHGVEGFAGSAVQLQLLENPPKLPDDAALVLVHVLNPYGMAYLRPFNENNVDLNRNFLGAEDYEGAPEKYPELDSFLNPQSPPKSDFYLLRAGWILLRHGFGDVKQAIAGGQYEYPKGLFFGGKKLEHGPQEFEAFLAQRLPSAERIIAVDVHTGLGKFGEDTLLVEEQYYAVVRAALGDRAVPSDPNDGPAYRVKGAMYAIFQRMCPNARVMAVVQEFGTYGPLRVLHALREENRWHHYGGTLDHATKQNLKSVFCPNNDTWRLRVLERGRQLLDQVCVLLFSHNRS